MDFLCRFDKDWQGFDSGAIWEDIRLGVNRIGHWGRIAVVTDADSLRNTVNIFKVFWKGYLRHFNLSEYSKARLWVCETKRSKIEYEINTDYHILKLYLLEDTALSEDYFSYISKIVDAHLNKYDTLHGILIVSRHFPGWEGPGWERPWLGKALVGKGLGAMLSHLKLVRGHHRKIK